MPVKSEPVDRDFKPSHVTEVVDLASLCLSSRDTLHVWVLNPHVTYSSSQRLGVKSALKLLYRLISHDEADVLLEPVTSSVQEIPVEADALTAAQVLLKETSTLLPLEERVYKEWNVGLLDVYNKVA
jgi:hypothetical protein